MPPLGSKRASVSVKLPEIVTNPERKARKMLDATLQGLTVAMTKQLSAVQTDGSVPVNTAALVKSLTFTRPQVRGSRVESSFIAPGPPSVYANVMDKGRTPGKRLWHGWLLYGRGSERDPNGWQTGWVNRKMRNSVVALAAKLRAEGGGKNMKALEKRAAFLLARKVARNIVAKGIKAREFFRRYAKPGPKRDDFVYGRVRFELLRAFRRRGLTG